MAAHVLTRAIPRLTPNVMQAMMMSPRLREQRGTDFHAPVASHLSLSHSDGLGRSRLPDRYMDTARYRRLAAVRNPHRLWHAVCTARTHHLFDDIPADGRVDRPDAARLVPIGPGLGSARRITQPNLGNWVALVHGHVRGLVEQ